jgi:hypothetical protein
MTKRQDRDAIYVKRQFDTEIIVLCVRWYITYRLSYRDPGAMMAVVRNNSRRGHFDVPPLQTRADSGMISVCCSWRERSSE